MWVTSQFCCCLRYLPLPFLANIKLMASPIAALLMLYRLVQNLLRSIAGTRTVFKFSSPGRSIDPLALAIETVLAIEQTWIAGIQSWAIGSGLSWILGLSALA